MKAIKEIDKPDNKEKNISGSFLWARRYVEKGVEIKKTNCPNSKYKNGNGSSSLEVSRLKK